MRLDGNLNAKLFSLFTWETGAGILNYWRAYKTKWFGRFSTNSLRTKADYLDFLKESRTGSCQLGLPSLTIGSVFRSCLFDFLSLESRFKAAGVLPLLKHRSKSPSSPRFFSRTENLCPVFFGALFHSCFLRSKQSIPSSLHRCFTKYLISAIIAFFSLQCCRILLHEVCFIAVFCLSPSLQRSASSLLIFCL